MINNIVVIGNIGSGKSTLSDSLARALNAEHIKADELYKINPFFRYTLEDRMRWSLVSDMWFLMERVKMMQLFQEQNAKRLVIDSGLPMSWVYACSRVTSGYFTQEEWELFESYYRLLTDNLPKPELVIYLKGDPGELRERIEKRGREFEIKHHSIDYLESLDRSLERLVADLEGDGVKVMSFDMNILTEEIVNNVVEQS